jgi:hypothetical protein
VSATWTSRSRSLVVASRCANVGASRARFRSRTRARARSTSASHGHQARKKGAESTGDATVTGESAEEGRDGTCDTTIATTREEAGDMVEKALKGAGERAVALKSGGEIAEERCDGAGELAAAVEACHEGSSALRHRLTLQAAHNRADVAT